MACLSEARKKGKYRIEKIMEDHEKGIIRCTTCERTTDNPKGEFGSAAESFLKTFSYSKETIGFYEVGSLGKIPTYACEVRVEAGIWKLSAREREKSKVAEVRISR